jgi:hypothetical protein
MSRISQLLILSAGLGLLGSCGGGSSGGASGSATQFSVSGPSNSGAGVAFAFTVTALTGAGSDPNYAGTVHFTSSDPAAVLPPDSALVNGTRTFSATLTNAGFQTITATDTISRSVHGSMSVTAVAGAYPVMSFGAKGDGQTDDTSAIQSAINAASAAGGGTVLFSVARYFTTGTLTVPQGVVLSGVTEGPFDVGGINPALIAVASTLLVTNTKGPFLTLQGVGAGVTDLLFHYPNQVTSSATAPSVFPYTILMSAPGTKVVRSTVTNAYDFLDIEAGRTMAQNLFIGAFHIGTNIDHAYDHVTLRTLNTSVIWDIVENLPYPQPIDTWGLNHSIALVVGRADSLEVSDFNVFSHFTGILLTDSPDTSLNPRCGYGSGSDIDIEGVQYAIVVTASNAPGYKFTNAFLEAQGGIGQAAVQVRAGGSMPPNIEINGVSQGNPWASGAFPPPDPDVIVVNILP